MAAAARGEEWAISELFGRWQPRLLAYFRTFAPRAAEDLAAQVWLDAARGLARFVGDEQAFSGWLFTIARRRLADHRRTEYRRPPAEALDPDAGGADPGSDGVVLAALDERAALRLIASLPHDQAQVLTLRVVAGLDVARTAEALGKRPGAVRTLQHRALRSLERALAAVEVTL